MEVRNHCDTWISVAAIVSLLFVQIQEDFGSQHMSEITRLLLTAVAHWPLEVMGRKSQSSHLKATGSTSAEGALKVVTWKLVRADERNLPERGMSWTGTLNGSCRNSGWCLEVRLGLKTELKRREQINYRHHKEITVAVIYCFFIISKDKRKEREGGFELPASFPLFILLLPSWKMVVLATSLLIHGISREPTSRCGFSNLFISNAVILEWLRCASGAKWHVWED